MIRVLLVLLGTLWITVAEAGAETTRFEKVSEHFYYFQANGAGTNVGAVVTDDGVLLINPPGEPELSIVTTALKRVSGKVVRWVIATDYKLAQSGELAKWAEQGALVLGSKELWKLGATGAGGEIKGTAPNRAEGNPTKPESSAEEKLLPVRIEFDRQIYLFPGGVEVRIFALQQRARTAGDVVVLLPGEKVLQAGNLFDPGSFPEIDTTRGGGNAADWIAGLKQVVDSLPLLKTAMPQPKPDPGKAPLPEKSLEELVTVIPGRGPRSNLQEMKNLLEAAQKLKTEMNKFVAAHSSREKLATAPAFAPFRIYANFELFAGQLFDALANK